MMNYLIGTGGWGYFKVPGINSLVAYSRIFNFVEVNSTFYVLPSLERAEEWRRLVQRGFEFAVRAHRSITHKHKLQPVEEALETFERMKKIAQKLRAQILHLQTPPRLKLTDNIVEGFRQFMSSVRLGDLRLALELRDPDASRPPSRLLKVMQDNGMIHCVDLSRGETPAYDSDIIYTRLFGKGQHNIYEPTDEELVQIDRKASASKAEKVSMSFHFVKMYKDAARLKVYKQTGSFPMVTKSTGESSLEEILREDDIFPMSKQELIEKEGWKVFDVTKTKRVHAAEYLKTLPDEIYNSVDQVIDKLAVRLR
jgi:uncharacterized protein YecE (DUF72 family)